jgi:hypothetical protein
VLRVCFGERADGGVVLRYRADGKDRYVAMPPEVWTALRDGLGGGIDMKFKVKDLADIPEIGFGPLIAAAKTLPVGKVIEVETGELYFPDKIVLGTLIKATGFKFIAHHINGTVVFQRVDGRRFNTPPANKAGKLKVKANPRGLTTPEAKVAWIRRRENLWYVPRRELFLAMKEAGLYAPTTNIKDADGLDALVALARSKTTPVKRDTFNETVRDRKAVELGYYQVKTIKELKDSKTGYVGRMRPLVEKYKEVAVALSTFQGNDSLRQGFVSSLRNAGYTVEKVKRSRGASYVVRAGELKGSYWETKKGLKELDYARRSIAGREDQFKAAYVTMTGEELKQKFGLPSKSWASKIATALGLAKKGVGWKKSHAQQNGHELTPA